jgi:hypothetical protein
MYFWRINMRNYLTIGLAVMMFQAFGQTAGTKKKEPGKITGDQIFNIQFHYTYVLPEGDMLHQFGNFHSVGMGGLYKTQHNLVLGFDASFQFGSKIKDYSFLDQLTNSSGVVMNSSGNPAVYNVGMRGFNAFAKVGYIFPVSWRNPNSGIMVLGGVGMYYHKMNISTTGTVPTLTEDLKKGYDRLQKGPAFNQFVGYYYNSPNRFYNFYIGIDFLEAYTKSVRKYNYATRLPDTEQYFDMNIGFRIGWMIPLYMKVKNDENEYQFR